MFGLSYRAYFVIGIFVGLGAFLLGTFAGTEIGNAVVNFRNQAVAFGIPASIAGAVADPLAWALSGDIVASVLTGLFWPFLLLWFILLLLMLIITFVGGGMSEVQRSTGI